MVDPLPLVFGAPGTYAQRPGIVASAGAHLAQLGDRILGIVDPVVWKDVEPALAGACQTGGIAWRAERFSGECTEERVSAFGDTARTWRPAAIVAAGGGKVLDSRKLGAEALGLPSGMIPTIAATDAPTSRIAVVYNDAHVVTRVAHLRAKSALVLVDTAIIVNAPIRFLVAGMGAALSTWPEARACALGAARTPLGGGPSQTALTLAELCYRSVLSRGRQARGRDGRLHHRGRRAHRGGRHSIERFGIRERGLAVAHALHAGQRAAPACAPFLHGEKVAFGVPVQAHLMARGRAA